MVGNPSSPPNRKYGVPRQSVTSRFHQMLPERPQSVATGNKESGCGCYKTSGIQLESPGSEGVQILRLLFGLIFSHGGCAAVAEQACILDRRHGPERRNRVGMERCHPMDGDPRHGQSCRPAARPDRSRLTPLKTLGRRQ